MASITQANILNVTRSAYKRVEKRRAQKIDRKKRTWFKFLESIKEETTFDGGAIVYPVQTSFTDEGTTWAGDDEIEASEPDFTLNLEYGYFNYANAILIKHDMLIKMGYSIAPNGDGDLSDRAMSKDDAYKIIKYVERIVEGNYDNHEKRMDRLLLRSGAAKSTDPVGLFGILTQGNSTGNVGGLSRATYTALRHVYQTGLTPAAGGDFRVLFTQSIRSANLYSDTNGVDGRVDFIMAGQTFIDAYTQWGELNNYRVNRDISEVKAMKFDFSIPDSTLHWEGVPIVHNPSMDDLDSVDTFSPTCTKMAVCANSKTWHYKVLRKRYKILTSPQDPPKQRVSRQDIDSTAHIACDAPASNALIATD